MYIFLFFALTLAKYIVLTPHVSSQNKLPVELLVFDGYADIQLELFNALDLYCWNVQGSRTKENLIRAGCMGDEPILTTQVQGTTGWNSANFDTSHVEFSNLYVVVTIDGDEKISTVTLATPAPDRGLLIQTDKGLYKPGETLKFRVIPVERDLSTFTANITVKLTSPDSMLMAKWEVEVSEYLKSEFPIDAQIGDNFLGTWTIEATSGELTAARTVDLEEYVLQTFSASVNTPDFVLSSAERFDVLVRGEYTYGEGVTGIARLQYRSAHESECWGGYSWYFPGEAWSNDVCGWSPQTKSSCTCTWDEDTPSWYGTPKQTPIELSTILINGDATFTLETSTIDDFGQRDVCTRVFVEENGTEQTEDASASILVDEHEFKLVLEDAKCVPGFDFVTTLTFADPAGNPSSPPSGEPIIRVYKQTEDLSWNYKYSDSDDNSNIGYGYSSSSQPAKELIDHDTFVTVTKTTPEGGIVLLTVDSAGFNFTTYSLVVEVEYGNDQEAVLNVNCLYAKDAGTDEIAESRLRVTASRETALVGDMVTFTVDTTKNFVNTYYLLTSGQAKGPEPATILGSGEMFSIEFEMEVELAHVPELRFTAFAEDGTLLADFAAVAVAPRFATTSATYGEDEVLPGGSVTLNLEADAGTVLVGIVDSSLLLMSTPNDITQSYVLDAVMPADVSGGCSYYLDANEAITDSGLLLMSSNFANLPTSNGEFYPIPVDFRNGVAEDGMEWDAAAAPEMAGGSGYMDKSTGTTVQQRSFFPESWIWQEYTFDELTDAIIVTAPDTITSWTMTAFSLGESSAMGISAVSSVTTFKPFFVSLALPYNVVRGEEFALNVTLFNYLETELEARVEVALPPELAIPGATLPLLTELDLEQKADGTLVGTWTLPGRQSIFKSLPVRATTIGSFDVVVTAVPTDNNYVGDEVTKAVLVASEGVLKESTNNVAVQGPDSVLTAHSPSWHSMHLSWPENRVQGSEQVLVSLTGDLMGSSVANLDYLIQQPCGCGEQNMLYTAPQVYVFSYLQMTDQLSGTQRAEILANLHTGYTRELKYMHSGEDLGGFSAFGDSDPEPSTWLTAFVTLVFVDIIRLQPELGEHVVDPSVVEGSVSWLLTHQDTATGRFPVVGRVIHEDMTGGVSDSDSLTCYVLSSLLAAESVGLLRTEEQRAQLVAAQAVVDTVVESYLVRDVSNSELYTFSVCAHAYLQYHSEASDTSEVYNKLKLLAKTSVDMEWWDNKGLTDESLKPDDDCWDCETSQTAVAVEMTSYNVLSILGVADSLNVRSAVNWLLKQRNHQGGFSSTQDTCMGLKALASFAVALTSGDVGLVLEMRLADGEVTTMTLDQSNKQIYQLSILSVNEAYPENTFQWRVLAEGVGTGYLGITQQYHYVPEDSDVNNFHLHAAFSSHDDFDCGLLDITTKWSSSASASGMVIVNAKALTGCLFDDASLADVEEHDNVRLVENEGGDLTIYLNELSTSQSFRVGMKVDTPVTNAQAQPVYVQQYYNPVAKKIVLYSHDDNQLGSSEHVQQGGSLSPSSFLVLLGIGSCGLSFGFVLASSFRFPTKTDDDEFTEPLALDDVEAFQ